MREHPIRELFVVDDDCPCFLRGLESRWLWAGPLDFDDRCALVLLGADPVALVDGGRDELGANGRVYAVEPPTGGPP
jgi:hypothetical protein